MATTHITITPPPAASPHTSTPPETTPETQTPISCSPIATPGSSSRLPSVHSRRCGRSAPPNSVAGCAPYGAFSRGIDRGELRHIPADYEDVWKDPTPTPRTRTPHASPAPSPADLTAHKLDQALSTIPEALESLPTPRYFTSSRWSHPGTVVSDATSLSEGTDALYISFKSDRPSIPLSREVEFLTASGVLEYNTWSIEAHDDMDNALRRAKQLAVDMNKKNPRKSVEQYYNEFLEVHLSNPALNMRYTPHEDRRPDATPDEVKAMEAKIEELSRAVGELRSENVAMKRQMTEIKQKAEKAEVGVAAADGSHDGQTG